MEFFRKQKTSHSWKSSRARGFSRFHLDLRLFKNSRLIFCCYGQTRWKFLL